MHSPLSIHALASGKQWAVMRTETQDGSSDDFTQCAHRREQPTCLRSYTCPCPCLTAQPVFNDHSGIVSSFRFAVAYISSYGKYTGKGGIVRSQWHHILWEERA